MHLLYKFKCRAYIIEVDQFIEFYFTNINNTRKREVTPHPITFNGSICGFFSCTLKITVNKTDANPFLVCVCEILH